MRHEYCVVCLGRPFSDNTVISSWILALTPKETLAFVADAINAEVVNQSYQFQVLHTKKLSATQKFGDVIGGQEVLQG